MQSSVSTWTEGADRFLLIHACLIPLALAVAAFALHASGMDEHIAAAFFDPARSTFPARGWPLFETLGHRVAKSAVVGFWLSLLAAGVVSAAVPRFRGHAAIVWITVLAMALGPTIVVVLKEINAYRCPWDLVQFGGAAQYASGWFVPNVNAGRCFPSGHAAGGFSLVALFFAGCAGRNRRLQRAGLAAALLAGLGFSLVRIAQGAHFLSHNLWSAAIDWCAAALVFAPTLRAARLGGENTIARSNPSACGPKTAATGWRRIGLAAVYSSRGLRAVWRREAAFRQEVAAAALLCPVAILADVTTYARCALLVSLGFVLVVELLNSAIEAVVDLVSPEQHPLAGLAKDAGSAAVGVSLAIAAAVWLTILSASS
ncbi:MAG: diacylglycerol kinase [Burkholderiales bacterium]|nr:diacylglycerol kinase [Burkholderiales bacterium]